MKYHTVRASDDLTYNNVTQRPILLRCGSAGFFLVLRALVLLDSQIKWPSIQAVAMY